MQRQAQREDKQASLLSEINERRIKKKGFCNKNIGWQNNSKIYKNFQFDSLFVENQLAKSIFQSGHFMSCLIWIQRRQI